MKNADEELIIEYIGGNSDSLKLLFSKYTKTIYNFVLFSIGTSKKSDAEDVTQEIFIKVWKNINKFNSSKSSFKTWIFIIARSSVIDFLRKRKSITFSELADDIENFEENIKDESLLQDEQLEKLENVEYLESLLEKISFEYKNILILHYKEEMTFDEISKVLKKPLNTIKSHHRRAILKLRDLI